MCMCAWSLQLCPVLCDLMDCSHPQDAPGRNTGLPYPPPRDLPDPGIEPGSLISPALAGGFFTTEPPGKPHYLVTGDQLLESDPRYGGLY